MGLEITRAVDYGLRAVLYLAEQWPEGSVLVTEMASFMDVPYQFLHKVMPRLVRARIVLSKRGVRGGYQLARPPGEITLLDVIEAIEGPILLNRCLAQGSDCSRSGACALQEVWRRARGFVREHFGSYTLQAILDRQRELDEPGGTSSRWGCS